MEPILTNNEIRDLVHQSGLKAIEIAKMIPCDPSHLSKLQRTAKITPRMSTVLRRVFVQIDQSMNNGFQPANIHSLPVVQRTQFLNIRGIGDQKVLTYRDLAEAYQVDEAAIRRVYNDNKADWKEPEGSASDVPAFGNEETFNHVVKTNGGPQTLRLFTFRGAIRFAFHIRSTVADQIQSHLLDLIEAEAKGEPQIINPTTQPEWGSALAQFANIAGVAIQNIKADQARLETKVEQLATKIEQAPVASVTESVNATLQALQDLTTRKVRLHDVVRAIVAQASMLPSDDPDALYYRNWGNTWRTIHRHANPPVNAITGYTSLQQIENAIMGGEAILVRLGGKVPVEQLALEGVA